MNVLFICSRNKWRSPTAETIYKGRNGLYVLSAGTEVSARIKVNAKLVKWADIIFVMEKKHKERLIDKFSSLSTDKKIIVLDIPDDYQYMDEELVESIKASVSPYLDA